MLDALLYRRGDVLMFNGKFYIVLNRCGATLVVRRGAWHDKVRWWFTDLMEGLSA